MDATEDKKSQEWGGLRPPRRKHSPSRKSTKPFFTFNLSCANIMVQQWINFKINLLKSGTSSSTWKKSGRGPGSVNSRRFSPPSALAAGKNFRAVLLRNVTTCAVWYLWRERNCRIFFKKETNKTELVKQIANTVLIRLSAANQCSTDANDVPILCNTVNGDCPFLPHESVAKTCSWMKPKPVFRSISTVVD